jgi:D,D-heptose 1,7-bisphosphate phosphatase
MSKAAFLDRDGVINHDSGYVHRWEDCKIFPGAVDALCKLSDAGYALVVVTNQSGIARGIFTESQYQDFTDAMRSHLRERGAQLLDVLHCPHHPKGVVPELSRVCDCRKPQPGLLLRASQQHRLNLASSIMIGDRPSDILAAKRAGIPGRYLIHPSTSSKRQMKLRGVTAVFPSLACCVDQLMDQMPLSQTN